MGVPYNAMSIQLLYVFWKSVTNAKVCILITTYKLNENLFELILEINYCRATYSGLNYYEIAVSDSDSDNMNKAQIADLVESYQTNTGKGFDDNFFYIVKNHHKLYDWIFAIADDDLLLAGPFNPLNLIDATIATNKKAVLFNSLSFENELTKIKLKGKRYNDQDLLFSTESVYYRVLRGIPSYGGILYS